MNDPMRTPRGDQGFLVPPNGANCETEETKETADRGRENACSVCRRVAGDVVRRWPSVPIRLACHRHQQC